MRPVLPVNFGTFLRTQYFVTHLQIAASVDAYPTSAGGSRKITSRKTK